MEEEGQNIGKGVFLAVCAFAAFSVSDAIRKLVALNYDILDILFWQAVAGMLVLCLVCPFLGGVGPLLNLKNVKLHLIRGGLIALNTTFSITAISRIPIVDAYTIFFLTPFAVSLMGVFLFKEKIGPYRLFSILCGFIGAFIAFRPGFNDINPAYILALVCVFTFSTSSILVRYFRHDKTILSFAFWPFFVLISGILIYKQMSVTWISDISFLVYVTLAGGAYGLALLAIAYSYTLGPASAIAPYQYTQIIFALGFGYVLFGDVPDIYKIVGAGMIIVSGIVLFAREKRLKTGKGP